jgi:hypothetical protein
VVDVPTAAWQAADYESMKESKQSLDFTENQVVT